MSTLSLLDLTYVAPARDKLDTLFENEQKAIRENTENYANISIAASGAYTFTGDTQIDLVDYLTRLADLDYNNNILAEAQYKDLIDSVKACVVVRNGNAPVGTNGVAFCFPARMISSYSPTYEQLDAMGLENEKAVCNDYFSIMASQQTKALSNDSFLKEFAHTDTYGKKVRVLRDSSVSVKDEPFGECDLQFGGMLTDIYQRTFLTETLETHVEK